MYKYVTLHTTVIFIANAANICNFISLLSVLISLSLLVRITRWHIGVVQRVPMQARHGHTVAYSYLRTAMTNKPQTYYKTSQRPKDNYSNHASFFSPTCTYGNKSLLQVHSVCGIRPLDIINCLITDNVM